MKNHKPTDKNLIILPETNEEHLEWLQNAREILKDALFTTLIRFGYPKEKRCHARLLGAIDQSIIDLKEAEDERNK